MKVTKLHDGSVTYDPREVLNAQSKFYEKLYTSNPTISFKYVNTDDVKLSEKENKSVNNEITISEIAQAIKAMPNSHTPGPDSLPAEFYKVFFIHIKEILLELYNFCFKVGRMHTSARRGVITLIPKSGRDLLLIKSWRPISLLCCDYKLVSKIITNRLTTIMGKVIHPDKNGFMEARHISTNTRKAIDVVDYVSRKNIATVLIQLDYEKAFDMVEYKSLFAAFNYFNMGHYIGAWLRVLFQDMQLSTINNGYTSKSFVPTRELFQGNPVTPLGFNALIELLAIKLRKNEHIKGIQICKVVHLISQFADDMDLFMQYNQTSWEAAILTFSD